MTAAANAAQQSEYTQQPGTEAQAIALDQLAGSLADELSLQKDFMQGSVVRLSFLVGCALGVLSFEFEYSVRFLVLGM